MDVLSTALNIVVAAARILPRIIGGVGSGVAASPAFLIAVLVGTSLVGVIAQLASTPFAIQVAALLIPRDAQAVITTPNAVDEMAAAGGFALFVVIVALFAVVAITCAFTRRRGVIVRVGIAALVGELLFIAAVLALMRELRASLSAAIDSAEAGSKPMIDVVSTTTSTMHSIVVFAIVGVLAGVAFAVIAFGPALRAREPKERRALLVAAGVAAPAALVLGGLAAPAPDIVSQLLIAFTIGIGWLITLALGLIARFVVRRG